MSHPVTMLQRITRPVIAGATFLGIAACAVDTPARPDDIQGSLVVNAPVTSLLLWKSMQLSVSGDSGIVDTTRLRWVSSDTDILRVDSTGRVTARSLGTVTITARRGNAFGRRVISVVLQRVDGGVRMQKGASGYWAPCAIAVSGVPYCSSQSNDSIPVFSARPGSGGVVFTSFATAQESYCGADTNGQGWCWGRSDHGIFGTGTLGPPALEAPTAIAGALRFKMITTGGHSQVCGINRSDDVLYCWGHNDGGQLGRGSSEQDIFLPGPVAGGLRAIDVATTNFLTCAIAVDGSAWCWSQSVFVEPRTILHSPLRLTGTPAFNSITVGEQHACALTGSGAAWCWGANAAGQLGTGTAEPIAAPMPVTGGHRFQSIAARYSTAQEYRSGACGVDLGGDVYCWGTVPFRITRSGDARSVFHGLNRMCIIKRDDTMWCT